MCIAKLKKILYPVHFVCCFVILITIARSQLLSFVNLGYSDWHNILEKKNKSIGKNTIILKPFVIAGRFEKVVNIHCTKKNEVFH